MPARINRAVELLEQGQPIYYIGGHTGHVLTYDQGRTDARTWADYINVGFEHGALDFAGLDEYMRGLIDGGPTASGHRTPAVIVEAPVDGIDEAHIRYAAWQFRVILGRGVHGVLLCQAESADVVRAFVESCRYPNQAAGVDPGLPSAVDRMRGASERGGGPVPEALEGSATRRSPGSGSSRTSETASGRYSHPQRADGRPWLGRGTRGRGSEPTASAVWGLSPEEYMERCDPWPLNRRGELLLGVKLESPEGVANADEILAVPGIGFAEMGPGDLGLSLGYVKVPRDPYPPEMAEAREKIFAACRRNGVAFLEGATPENVASKIDEGVRVIAGHREDTAQAGRAHSKRTMPV
jgi:4-hydroxy-2-oxoheptanedioate aldolase